jgi:hypothetical protein
LADIEFRGDLILGPAAPMITATITPPTAPMSIALEIAGGAEDHFEGTR